MSAIKVWPLTATAILSCSKCIGWWESRLFEPRNYGSEVVACAPAFAIGWRVFASGRGQRAYCPNCSPSTPMHLVHGDNLPTRK